MTITVRVMAIKSRSSEFEKEFAVPYRYVGTVLHVHVLHVRS